MFSFKEKKQFIILGTLGLLALFGILMFARNKPEGKGQWICRNGTWIAEGKPNNPMPKAKCY